MVVFLVIPRRLVIPDLIRDLVRPTGIPALAGMTVELSGGAQRPDGRCWVMQWTLPPPSRISLPGTVTIRRGAKTSA